MLDLTLKYWPILLFALNGLGIWVGWSVRKGVATKDDLVAHAEKEGLRLQGIETRLTHLEADVRHGPSDEDIERVHARLDETNAQISRLVGEFAGARGLLQTLVNQHLNEGKPS